MKNALPLILLFSLIFNESFSQTTVYSQGSGNWTTIVWNTMPGGGGSNVTDPNSTTTSVVIQSGHNISLDNGPRNVSNFTLEAGATLTTNLGSGSPRYIQIYGSSAVLDGDTGDSDDGLSLDVNGPACTISGSGTTFFARLKKDNDSGAAATTDLIIDKDITLTYTITNSCALYNDGAPGGSTLNVTINSGKTVSVSDSDVCIDGIDGTNSQNTKGTFTINGTLHLVSGDLWVTTDNPVDPTDNTTIAIGATGKIIVGGKLKGNSSATTGAAKAIMTVANGGVLELRGAGDPMDELSASRNIFTFNTGSTVVYDNASIQSLEDEVTHANLTVLGGDKTTEGATAVNGTLTLDGGLVILAANNLTIGSSGTVINASTTDYIQTNSTGQLIQQVGSSDVDFPVGNSSYNPITLNNTGGTADNYRIRVLDDVFTNGTTGPVITDNVVDRTWLVSEQAAGGTNLDITVQWNSAEELGAFDNTACYVSHYFGGLWNPDIANGAGGSDPYNRTRTGTTSISAPSPFAVGSNTELPIELTTLTALAQKRDILLRWETATERDNAYFAIERSADGNTFREIGQRPSLGNSRSPQAYNFIDPAPAKGTNYYRLRQVDTDGRFSYSPVVTALMDGAFFRLSPTAATDVLRLTASDPSEEARTWQVFDTAGRLLQSGIWEAESVQHELNVSDLPQGHYALRLTADQSAPTVLRFQKM